jgi:hypothetical protein
MIALCVSFSMDYTSVTDADTSLPHGAPNKGQRTTMSALTFPKLNLEGVGRRCSKATTVCQYSGGMDASYHVYLPRRGKVKDFS